MTVFLQQYGQPPTLDQLAQSPSFYRATFFRQLAKQRLNHLENQKTSYQKSDRDFETT